MALSDRQLAAVLEAKQLFRQVGLLPQTPPEDDPETHVQHITDIITNTSVTGTFPLESSESSYLSAAP